MTIPSQLCGALGVHQSFPINLPASKKSLLSSNQSPIALAVHRRNVFQLSSDVNCHPIPQ